MIQEQTPTLYSRQIKALNRVENYGLGNTRAHGFNEAQRNNRTSNNGRVNGEVQPQTQEDLAGVTDKLKAVALATGAIVTLSLVSVAGADRITSEPTDQDLIDKGWTPEQIEGKNHWIETGQLQTPDQP